jgi:hypothetical protein
MIEITAIRLAGGGGHEHITHVMWRTGASTGQSAATALVEWLAIDRKNRAVVVDGSRVVKVEVVRPAGGPPHLRTRAHGAWTDHLRSLPTF